MSAAVAVARGRNPLARVDGVFKSTVKLARAEPVGMIAVTFLLLLIVAAVFAPVIAQHNPTKLGPASLAGPSGEYWAGTDQFGRDVFTRTLFGARVSLTVGLAAAVIGSGGALLLALVFTYAGGWWDMLFQRFVDTNMALPSLILLLVLVQVVGPSIASIAAILGVRTAITSSRILRSAVLSAKSEDYVESAVAAGANPLRVMFRHVVPNVFSLAVVTATLQLGSLIIAEASLSFLGLGIRPPTPSWGGMMGVDGRAYIVQAPWMLIAPAIALCATVIAANMAGDFLRDKLDPRLRGKLG